ncbi:MAG: signal peptidase II [Spirochaetes bacterium]|nr:signal peptidase II [Spirochaetota bacterium]
MNIKEFVRHEKVLFLTVIGVILFDKITKIAVKHSFLLGESKKVLGNFFRLTFIENTGIAFGLFSQSSHPLKSIVLLILSLIALYFIISIYIRSEKTFLLQICFGLILGGAFGNVYDRIVYGKVVDFLDFGIGTHRWPFFNIADSSITIGVIMLVILTTFFQPKQKDKKARVKKKKRKT